MNLFGMGGMEIMVIMLVALIIFGPGKLPEIGAQVGKAVRDFRRATNDLTREFNDSTSDIRSTMDEMKGTMT
ncbi:MAG: twin-arginine translocase TatA/TatE family subunit, partial [Thermomicrobiales bacterium]